MSFFAVEMATKARDRKSAAPKTGRPASGVHIPIEAMRELGCRACPEDKGTAHSPKMQAEGSLSAQVLVLTGQPSDEEDLNGMYGTGPKSKIILGILRRLGAKTRMMSIARCRGAGNAPSFNATTCCRGHVEKEVAELRPQVIVGVGDAVLSWATGLSGSTAMRGRSFPVRIAGHDCWFFCVAEPWFVDKKRSRKSEHEFALEHDLDRAVRLLDGPAPKPVLGGYDAGIEIVTGREAGDMARLESFLHWSLSQPVNGVDWETSGLRPYGKDPHIYTASLGTFERTMAFAVDHPEGWGTDARMRNVRGMLGEWLLQSNTKVAHNLAFEMEWAHFFWGPRVLMLSHWEDTMLQAFTLDGRPGTKGLEKQTLLRFGFNVKAQSTVDAKRLLDYPLPDVLRYNGMDSKWTAALFPLGRQELQEIGLEEVYERRLRLAPSLVLAQAKGVPVNLDFAERYERELDQQVADIDRKIRNLPEVHTYERRFGAFNPGNDDHVLKLMDVVLKRPEVSSTDRDGNVRKSSDADALGAIPDGEVPSAPLILKRRGLEKILSTNLRPISTGRVIGSDGLVHTQYSSCTAVTGRLASEDPNLQNIPVRTAEGRKVREAFEAERNGWIAALDYGQIEARVIGMASEDQNLMRYQWEDYDIHGFWAARIHKEHPKIVDWVVKTFAVDWDEKGMKTLRQETKNKWVFPQFFGSRTESCAADLHLPEDVTARLGREFWDEFKGVKRWQARLVQFFEKHLYVESLGGFRRSGPMTLNELINAPVQSTAGEIVQAAQVELTQEAFKQDDPELQANLNIHDDLTFWLADATVLEKLPRIAAIMCRPRFPYITVPLIVEAKLGASWGDMKPFADYRSDVIYNLESPFK